ncbi:DUF2298 domain-containing protein [Rhodobacteraceae bacterium D3-12]|nr:DUF2298 domain-containing protein [Rhodobacteraceae bacterium D3-12]
MIGSLPPSELALLLRGCVVLALGAWAVRPLALRLVPGGAGWCVAILLAWVVIGWVPWAVAALGLIPFKSAAFSGVAALLILRGVAGVGAAGARGPEADTSAAYEALKPALWTFGAFAVLVWFGLAQRLGHAELSGLEKFTDMGLLAASMRSDWMPPQDAWFAGATINYYYVGQAMVASWAHIAGASAAEAYQIAMAILFALTGLGAWRLTVALGAGFGARIAQVLGAAAACVTLYGGNFHSVLYTLFRGVVPTTKEMFYFPDSTRFIGFDPATADKAFTEFPAYAFAVGDLHAHVIATPVFLLGLLLVLAILRRGMGGMRGMGGQEPAQGPDPVQAAALGWLLGLLVGVNAWDVAVLGVIALIVALVLAVQKTEAGLDRLGAAMVLALGVGALCAAPFLGAFTPFANGVEAAPARTPLWQLAVVYGHVLPAALLLLIALRWGGVRARAQLPTALILAAALLLIAIPETLIVRDIYGLDYARANSMFKLSFRAQSLLVVGGFAALIPAVARGGGWLIAALLAAVPMVATLSYAPHIFRAPSTIRQLDGLAFLGAERGLVTAAGRLSLAPGEAIIEASGAAFGETARVSAMTGLPTVIGWAGHEWLWRGDGAAANGRAALVRRFYETRQSGVRCDIIRRFQIRYVILGEVEKRSYPTLDLAGLEGLGPKVYDGAGGAIVQVAQGRCR